MKAKLLCTTNMPDVTNDDIWTSSAAIHQQADLQARLLVSAGSIGAQQAMLDSTVHSWLPSDSLAPWVPDLLGVEWTHPNAVFVVGMAPAGFIRGYSGRDHVLGLEDYLAARNWHAFQKAFVHQVVMGDHQHYERLSPLLNHTSRFGVFDLCRCSLVVRAPTIANKRQDGNINTRLLAHRTAFAAYAEHVKSKQWTKDRLLGSQARLVIALGFTAEYGLVRLFADLGMQVCDSLSGRLWKERRLRAPANWTYGYPGDRSLTKRYDPPSWWQIEEPTGRPRWAVVPVVHPSSWGDDPGYRRSRNLIAAAKKQIQRWTIH